MKKPFFSIITPTFNRAQFLNRCINSVINQTFTDWELIIIDDGSTDNTRNLVSAVEENDDRVKYYYQKNQKTSAARNLGLSVSSGKYICFLDSDDEYDEKHLQIFYNYLIENGFTNIFLYSRFRFSDNNCSVDFLPPKRCSYKDKLLDKIMNMYLPYSPPVQTICVPGEIRKKIKFNTDLYLSESYDFCARVASLYNTIFLPVTTVTLHGHNQNASVPRNISDNIKFNSRQFEEFRIMKKDPFYKEIKKTEAFKKRMQFLQIELSKAYFLKKRYLKSAMSFFMGTSIRPIYLFQLSYRRLFKRNLTS